MNDKSVQAINVIDLPSQLLVGLMVFVLVQLHVFCIDLDLLVKIERVFELAASPRESFDMYNEDTRH